MVSRENIKDEQLKSVLREKEDNKYNNNLRHGYVVGGHPFLGFKDGELTYVSINGVYMSRPITDDVLMSFIELITDRRGNKSYSPCIIRVSATNKNTGKSKVIYDNDFVGMSIREDRFLFLMSYLRGKSKSFKEFMDEFPVKRRIETTRTVYLTPNLVEVVEEKLSKLNESLKK